MDEQLEIRIRLALEKENLKTFNITNIGTKENGEGFLGGITFVDINATKESGEEKEYHLFIKDGDIYEADKKCDALKDAFRREILFYDSILPYYMQFQLDRGIKTPFNSVPKCFNTMIINNIEVIVLENLKKVGYEMHSAKIPLNWNHLKLVFMEYARFHAVSFAFKDQFPEEFKDMTEGLTDLMSAIMIETNGMKMFHDVYEENIELLNKYEEYIILQKYKRMHTEIDKIILRTNYQSNPYAILAHGDCWSNNFMFTYEDDNKQIPDKVKIVDWQFIKLASPVCDLIEFFYCSASTQDLPRYEELLDIYYEKLLEDVTALGSNLETLISKVILREQWKKYAKFGLAMGPTVYQIGLTDKEDFVDLKHVKDFSDVFCFKVKDEDTYFKRFIGLVEHMLDNGFI